MRGLEALRASNALIVNVDYPLGFAAYHLLSQIASSVVGPAGCLHHGQGGHAQRRGWAM